MTATPDEVLNALEEKAKAEMQLLINNIDDRLKNGFNIDNNRLEYNLNATGRPKAEMIIAIFQAAGWTVRYDSYSGLIFSMTEERMKPFKQKLQRHFIDGITSTPASTVKRTTKTDPNESGQTRNIDLG